MAQYVVHKIGFWYTDEGFEIGQEKGTVIAITQSLDQAKAIKSKEDINSLKRTAGLNPIAFFSDRADYDEIYNKLEAYFISTLDVPVSQKYRLELPKQLTDEQAAQLLSIIELSFHNIVEYSDEEVINAADYVFTDGDVGGF